MWLTCEHDNWYTHNECVLSDFISLECYAFSVFFLSPSGYVYNIHLKQLQNAIYKF